MTSGMGKSSYPELFRGNSSVDRALAFQAGGRGFEPRFPLHAKGRANALLKLRVAALAQW